MDGGVADDVGGDGGGGGGGGVGPAPVATGVVDAGPAQQQPVPARRPAPVLGRRPRRPGTVAFQSPPSRYKKNASSRVLIPSTSFRSGLQIVKRLLSHFN